uniref:Uncharacterized protein n=1 Tax=Romanomermis culicivorax TaxID=13658 RepID=A0A915L3P1_ROMCU
MVHHVTKCRQPVLREDEELPSTGFHLHAYLLCTYFACLCHSVWVNVPANKSDTFYQCENHVFIDM